MQQYNLFSFVLSPSCVKGARRKKNICVYMPALGQVCFSFTLDFCISHLTRYFSKRYLPILQEEKIAATLVLQAYRISRLHFCHYLRVLHYMYWPFHDMLSNHVAQITGIYDTSWRYCMLYCIAIISNLVITHDLSVRQITSLYSAGQFVRFQAYCFRWFMICFLDIRYV